VYAANSRSTGQPRNFDHLPLRYFSDFQTISPPDKFRKLLGTTALAVIFGPPACGKTFLVTDLGMHIALGWAWFGRSVTRGSVIYVAGEGVAGIGNRLAGFKAKHAPGEDVPFVVIPVAVNLGPGARDAGRVVEAVAEVEAHTGMPVRLIVVDTLARCLVGGDENSAQDMGQFLAACDRIRVSAGATVLIVHHVGKSAQAGARGSSAVLGAVDTAIEVETGDGGRVATVVKQKDGQDGIKIGFDLEVVEIGQDDEGEPITTCVVRSTIEIPKARRKLMPTQELAMEVLHNVLVDFGEPAPHSVTFPRVAVVKQERFKTAR
jgi:RecA-family ATPase